MHDAVQGLARMTGRVDAPMLVAPAGAPARGHGDVDLFRIR